MARSTAVACTTLTTSKKEIFEASKAAYESALQAAGRGRGQVTTEIMSANAFPDGKVFYYAEVPWGPRAQSWKPCCIPRHPPGQPPCKDYHQQYLAKPGARPYCSAQPQVVDLPAFESWCPQHLQAAT